MKGGAPAEAVKVALSPLVVPGTPPLLFLDANILLPQYLRSVFLDLAEAELVHAHWSEDVLVEVRRNLVSKRRAFGLTPERADKTVADMKGGFPQALVQGYGTLLARFAGATDPKDAHVAAGALKLSQSLYGGQPVVLVTANIKHLPQAAFVGTQVRVARPGTFLRELLLAEPEVAVVLADMCHRFKKPPVTKEDLLSILDASSCALFARELAAAWGFSAEA